MDIGEHGGRRFIRPSLYLAQKRGSVATVRAVGIPTVFAQVWQHPPALFEKVGDYLASETGMNHNLV